MKIYWLFIAIVSVATANAAPVEWTAPQTPFLIFGDTYYVGSQGLSAILITSADGHILIDVPMADNAAMIEANIQALGLRVQDIRLIVTSHAHYDHVGGVAAMAAASGAKVSARRAGMRALQSGGDDPDDPQFGTIPLFTPVATVAVVADQQTLKVGKLAVTAHATPGHTPGSTTWTWRSCEQQRCLNLVYADSLSAVSAPGYRFSDTAHPERLTEFRHSIELVSQLPCDILITPHPDNSQLLERQQRATHHRDAFVDSNACRRYALDAKSKLQARIATERAAAH